MVPSDSLVIHLRGSDRMAEQPPCVFFHNVVQTGLNGSGFHDVIAVAEPGRTENRCIGFIRSRFHGYLRVQTSDLVTDFITIMGAANLALSFGTTFSMAAMLVSPRQRINVFMPLFKSGAAGGENYDKARFDEICAIGRGSAAYEFDRPNLTRGRGWNESHLTYTLYRCMPA